MTERPTILIVDDELLNLEILREHLHDANYQTVSAEHGIQAWDLLKQHRNRFDAVLLDRMMPEMDGLELLNRIRNDAEMSLLPVIMQTAKATESNILEGLQAGASYYLTKPFDGKHLIALVKAAVDEYSCLKKIKTNASNLKKIPELPDNAEFQFRTPEEMEDLAVTVAANCESGEFLACGLLKLMLNAIEHGNLEIGYEHKARLLGENKLHEEVQQRLTSPDYSNRSANLYFTRSNDEYQFEISDQGSGFNWHDFLDIDPNRAFDINGHGIAWANAHSFDKLEFIGNGNTVKATKKIKPD